MDRPLALQERVFTRLFESAEIARFTKEQYEEYEDSLKAYRDWLNTINTAVMKSRAEGRAEGKLEEKMDIAGKLKNSGISFDVISVSTGLSEEEISSL